MKRILTGIKPTGTPHIGNYFGAIKQAIELSKNEDYEALYFIADYHALNTVKNPELFKNTLMKLLQRGLPAALTLKKLCSTNSLTFQRFLN